MDQINAIRKGNGKASLEKDPALCALAYIRAYECSISFAHTRPDGSGYADLLTDGNYACVASVENLHRADKGYPGELVIEDWSYSRENRDSMTHPEMTHMGVASYEKDGKVYTVALFVRK